MDPIHLVLASASPRRQSILAEAGFEFTLCVPPDSAEDAIQVKPGMTPEELALRKAQAKALAAYSFLEPRPGSRGAVLGADTVVALGLEILEKPLDRDDARAMLRKLSGSRHRVLTAVYLEPWPAQPDGGYGFVDESWVRMRTWTEAEVRAYVDSGEADGKAGAYAIQETADRFVTEIEGSFLNIVGFPLECFLLEWQRLQALWFQA
jgi:septum formation protein